MQIMIINCYMLLQIMFKVFNGIYIIILHKNNVILMKIQNKSQQRFKLNQNIIIGLFTYHSNKKNNYNFMHYINIKILSILISFNYYFQNIHFKQKFATSNNKFIHIVVKIVVVLLVKCQLDIFQNNINLIASTSLYMFTCFKKVSYVI